MALFFSLKEKGLPIERYLWDQGFESIAGLDEAGRGAIAGPLFVGLVIFPEGYSHPEIKDSKLLSPKKREELFEVILKEAKAYAIASATVEEINRLGLMKALFLAMERAIAQVEEIDLLLVDGISLVPNYKGLQKALVKGDNLSLSIAAGSILAKVSRDRFMERLSLEYPQYLFHKHKGYATAEHLKLIKKYGASPVHRTTFLCFKDG